jgi:hypothetical protein
MWSSAFVDSVAVMHFNTLSVQSSHKEKDSSNSFYIILNSISLLTSYTLIQYFKELLRVFFEYGNKLLTKSSKGVLNFSSSSVRGLSVCRQLS